MVLAEISLEYNTELHIHRRVYVTALWYQKEALDRVMRLYDVVVGSLLILMDNNTHPHRAAIVDDILESKGNGRLTPRTITLYRSSKRAPSTNGEARQRRRYSVGMHGEQWCWQVGVYNINYDQI
ncbi:hypothetical protein TNCV_3312981 [Trichonephila clavipes]|nr:hypothetical protein TNCV_3312981 [Trichonephila clavipes]